MFLVKDSIRLQEKIDASIAHGIIARKFGNKLTGWKEREEGSPSDVLLTGTTSTHEQHYSLEIKSINTNAYFDNGFLVQFEKLIGCRTDIEKRQNQEKLLWMFLSTFERKAYIFDLSTIDLNKVRMANIPIKSVEFHDSHKEIKPCLFLPLDSAVAECFYELTEEEMEMISQRNRLLKEGR